MTPEQPIESQGWNLEFNPDTLLYRATQGSFSALWRTKPEYVADDLRKMNEKPKSEL